MQAELVSNLGETPTMPVVASQSTTSGSADNARGPRTECTAEGNPNMRAAPLTPPQREWTGTPHFPAAITIFNPKKAPAKADAGESKLSNPAAMPSSAAKSARYEDNPASGKPTSANVVVAPVAKSTPIGSLDRNQRPASSRASY